MANVLRSISCRNHPVYAEFRRLFCKPASIKYNSYYGRTLATYEKSWVLQGRCFSIKCYSTTSEDKKQEIAKPKESLFARFKKMYKEYWYVLVPVHIVTSACWFGGFYYMAKSGVDVAGLLEHWQFSDKIVVPLKDSSMGYIAIAYACYKLATPARYAVTLGGTTLSINYLKKWGYIKPVPSKEKLKELYLDKKETILEAVKETKAGIKHKTEKLKDKKENLIEDLEKSFNKFEDKLKSTSTRIKNKKGGILNNIKKQ